MMNDVNWNSILKAFQIWFLFFCVLMAWFIVCMMAASFAMWDIYLPWEWTVSGRVWTLFFGIGFSLYSVKLAIANFTVVKLTTENSDE